MAEADFRIIYEGGDADAHEMDMRALALSLLGAEKIISDGLIVMLQKRLPKRGERAPVIAKAKEPVEGSLEIIAIFNAVYGLLPLGLPYAKELTSHFLEEWWKGVLARFSGKPEKVDAAIEALLAMNRDHLAARDASELRQHEERMAFQDTLRAAIAAQQRAAEQYATPIGPTVTSATAYPALARPITTNIDDANAIRDSGKLSWGPLERLNLRTEGFRFHTNGLSIENPEKSGYLMARVRDPRFDEPSNPYTEAAQRRAEILVLGRQAFKDGALAGIEIVDFICEVIP